VPKATPKAGAEAKSLDQINLEQALIDLEIANARVIDLTQRLNETSAELLRTRQQLGRAQRLIARLPIKSVADVNDLAHRAVRKAKSLVKAVLR
jgi:hypothetical protein